jgi:hypothetical protein
MVLIDARVHSEHLLVIRSDIEAESIEKSRVVEMGQRIPLGSHFQTPRYF